MSSGGRALLRWASCGPEPCTVLYIYIMGTREAAVVPAEGPEPICLDSTLSCVASYSFLILHMTAEAVSSQSRVIE